MEEMYSLAKAVASSPEYKKSNPTLAMMEQLQYVMYENYEKFETAQQYTLEQIPDREVFIRDLQAAYLEDCYRSILYADEVVYEDKYAADTEPVAVGNHGHYILHFDSLDSAGYFDPEKAVTLKGGIIDGFYPAVGLQCWLTPQYKEEDEWYWDEYTGYSESEVYLYSEDFPKTCAVLDRLRPAEEK